MEELEPDGAPRIVLGFEVRVQPLADVSLVVGHQLVIPTGQGNPQVGARQRITLQTLEHGEQVARLAVAHIRRGESLVFEHPREHQDSPRRAVATVRRHVVGIAVHQSLHRVRAPAEAGRKRGRELLQLLPPPVADIGSWSREGSLE